jgi:hypothetical protein
MSLSGEKLPLKLRSSNARLEVEKEIIGGLDENKNVPENQTLILFDAVVTSKPFIINYTKHMFDRSSSILKNF